MPGFPHLFVSRKSTKRRADNEFKRSAQPVWGQLRLLWWYGFFASLVCPRWNASLSCLAMKSPNKSDRELMLACKRAQTRAHTVFLTNDSTDEVVLRPDQNIGVKLASTPRVSALVDVVTNSHPRARTPAPSRNHRKGRDTIDKQGRKRLPVVSRLWSSLQAPSAPPCPRDARGRVIPHIHSILSEWSVTLRVLAKSQQREDF